MVDTQAHVQWFICPPCPHSIGLQQEAYYHACCCCCCCCLLIIIMRRRRRHERRRRRNNAGNGYCPHFYRLQACSSSMMHGTVVVSRIRDRLKVSQMLSCTQKINAVVCWKSEWEQISRHDDFAFMDHSAHLLDCMQRDIRSRSRDYATIFHSAVCRRWYEMDEWSFEWKIDSN